MYSLMVGIGILLSYTIGRDGKKIQDKLGNHGVKQQSKGCEVLWTFLLPTLLLLFCYSVLLCERNQLSRPK